MDFDITSAGIRMGVSNPPSLTLTKRLEVAIQHLTLTLRKNLGAKFEALSYPNRISVIDTV